VVSSAASASSLTGAYLSGLRGRGVEVVAPQRGRRRRVLELATNDARAVIDRDSLRRQSDHNVRSRALQELGDALRLSQPPFRIECFDMSHLQGTNYVGSMVVFEDAIAKKADYRHFNVKEILGNDDVGAMQEVVTRRLTHLREDQSTTKFRRPDLIIIDGGLPQLHAAEKAAVQAGATGLEFAALAKREELLFRPGSSTPIALERGSEGLYLVQRIRDEAHRFAITFHRSKRAKSMVASSLLDALRQASLADLEGLAWLPQSVARNIYDHLQAPSVPRPTKGSAGDE
ncbi:MAG: excinuclease ABC subunit C, partial [Acidimicrobiales bacterium]